MSKIATLLKDHLNAHRGDWWVVVEQGGFKKYIDWKQTNDHNSRCTDHALIVLLDGSSVTVL